jgi:hypothetical protein
MQAVIGYRQLAINLMRGGGLKALPHPPTPTPIRPAGDYGAPRRRFSGVGALLVAAVLAGSCSTSTSGTAKPAHSTASKAAPTSATAANSPAAAPPSAATSDEDQVRETVTAWSDAYNTQNWEAYTELMCTAMRAQFTGVVMDYVKRNRANTGVNTIQSIAVSITGDTATATITGTNEGAGTGTITLPLKREDGWKVCQVYHP